MGKLASRGDDSMKLYVAIYINIRGIGFIKPKMTRQFLFIEVSQVNRQLLVLLPNHF